MKRNPHLIPLSWDHHTGLTIAKRLKEGAETGESEERLRSYAVRHWQEHLERHFRVEEALLPRLLEGTAEGRDLNDRLFREHAEIRMQLDGLEREEAPTGWPVALAASLRSHIQFEERVYFPAIEETASEAELAGLGDVLHREYRRTDPRVGL
ncbi:MAG: hemerythrin domain-containing protein [Candidatus Hydrogenedentes bacterium]|nr:hemerythrin domain-containing protein [Candidatus Hydrogenedentota bacterium]